MKRSALDRKTPLRRPAPKLGFSEPGRAEWKTPQKGYCAVCSKPSWRLHHHHVYPESKVRQAGGWAWDPRNGIYICELCHKDHHDALRGCQPWRIPLSCVPRDARLFLISLIGRGRAELFFQRYYGTAPFERRSA